MNGTPARMPSAQFSLAARTVLARLGDTFLEDEDLADDLDAVLGAAAGPTGVAGAKRRQRRSRILQRCLRRRLKPSREEVVRVGRDVTRLDRLLGRLVHIAEERQWQAPFPNVEGAIAQAKQVRAHRPLLVGELTADRGRLRLLAMAAADLLDRLATNEEAP
ncbi:hypothetical protein [Streptomyces murinus]|uniref:hypothetical protein n=1 Tax=Streptomyces murinus TaxID=33900 RepID=UPI003F457C3B